MDVDSASFEVIYIIPTYQTVYGQLFLTVIVLDAAQATKERTAVAWINFILIRDYQMRESVVLLMNEPSSRWYPYIPFVLTISIPKT